MTHLVTVSNELQFHLANERISYVFRVSAEGLLEHIYFGARVDAGGLAGGPRRAFRGATLEYQGVANLNLSDTAQEYPLFGSSDTRNPALHLLNADGNTTSNLTYMSHQIVADKPVLSGLPSARGAAGESQTLLVTLQDTYTGLQVELCYTIYARHDVIARACVLKNQGERALNLRTVMSSTLELPAENYELLHLTGSWAREFNVQRMAVPFGRFEISSTCGASSNAHSPFLAVLEEGATERSGAVFGTALMYSGNFAISVERGEFEAVRINAGINPFNFNWLLEPGDAFTTPESLQVFSANGLDGMSQIWHAFVQQQISPPQFYRQPRPTYLNSWEAAYFDVSHDSILALAGQAREIGVEMLVVDDGWFVGRDDDTTSLGDWFSDKRKFPQGIEATAAAVKAMGLKFGLWFEPEMVNEQSQLFADHPDWIVHVPGRARSTGRGQLILDLSRPEVVEYLFERLDSFLSCGDIDYVKWDMNRVMSEIGSAALTADRQLETPHRYMLGVYSLIGRLVERHPDVLFENCASGGNRFDLGMLNFMAQGWVSDMSEPIGRLPIVNGASYVFPPSVLASYIGPVPSHQNDRVTSLKLRTEVGFFCAARGLSLNIADLQADETQIRAAVELYKRTADDLVGGRFHRLKNTTNEVCWQLDAANGERIYLGYFHILSAANLPYRRVRLVDLDATAWYQVRGGDACYAGSALMDMGLDLPYVHAVQLANQESYMERGDFSSCLLELVKVAQPGG